MHFVFRFLHASHAAEILALAGRLREDGALEGWPSLAGMIERLCCEAGMVALLLSPNHPLYPQGWAIQGSPKLAGRKYQAEAPSTAGLLLIARSSWRKGKTMKLKRRDYATKDGCTNKTKEGKSKLHPRSCIKPCHVSPAPGRVDLGSTTGSKIPRLESRAVGPVKTRQHSTLRARRRAMS